MEDVNVAQRVVSGVWRTIQSLMSIKTSQEIKFSEMDVDNVSYVSAMNRI